MEEARKGGRNAAFLDRLLLTPERVEHMARGMEQVAALLIPWANASGSGRAPTACISARCAFPWGSSVLFMRAAAPLPAMPPPCA